MPIPYKARKAILANKEGKKLYHPQVVSIGNCSLNDLAKEVAELSSLSTGDVKNTVDNLISVMTRHLQSGESVTLDGLGNFTLSFKSRGNGVENPDDVSPSDARLRINFRPATTRNNDRTVATRSLLTGSSFVRWGHSALNIGSGSTETEDPDNTGDSGSGTGGNPL